MCTYVYVDLTYRSMFILHYYKYYLCISRLRITTCFDGLAVLRSGLSYLGIAIPMLRIALKNCNKLLLEYYYINVDCLLDLKCLYIWMIIIRQWLFCC